jgi:hypothetical protein
LEKLVGALENWTHMHGKALCPPPGSCDSYGDGKKDAKGEVLMLLAAAHEEVGKR